MLKAEFEELIQQILKNPPDLTREEAEMLVGVSDPELFTNPPPSCGDVGNPAV